MYTPLGIFKYILHTILLSERFVYLNTPLSQRVQIIEVLLYVTRIWRRGGGGKRGLNISILLIWKLGQALQHFIIFAQFMC